MWKAPLIGLVAFYLGCGGTVPAQTPPSTPPPRDASNGCSVERPCPAAPAQGWGPSHSYGAGDIRPCGARGCVEMQRRCDARSDGAAACPEGLVCDQGTCIDAYPRRVASSRRRASASRTRTSSAAGLRAHAAISARVTSIVGAWP